MHKVQSLVYRMKIGGPGHGCPLFDLMLGTDGKENSTLDLIELLTQVHADLKDKSRIVQMYVTPELTNEDEIRELIVALKDNGFSVIGNVLGIFIPSYIKEFNSVIANIREPRWLNFLAQEIHYYPSSYPIEEPIVSAANQKAFKYVMMTDKGKAQHVFDFLGNASTLWGIIPPHKWSYEMEIT